jgi:hypothetical protein
MMSAEEQAWLTTPAEHLWMLDKLILSRYLGYLCGPTGVDVPEPASYIVRPCVNAMGLGLGASIQWLDKDTDHLPLGAFWCEIFEGRHLSIDYEHGEQRICVEGRKPADTLQRWSSWSATDDRVECPEFLREFESVNIEMIGNKLIEVHFRHNEDFPHGCGYTNFIPVWEGESTTPPSGYRYLAMPEHNGRIGAFVL